MIIAQFLQPDSHCPPSKDEISTEKEEEEGLVLVSRFEMLSAERLVEMKKKSCCSSSRPAAEAVFHCEELEMTTPTIG